LNVEKHKIGLVRLDGTDSFAPVQAGIDYIDIGSMLPNSGAVPVVIKSLIFPASAAPGMERRAIQPVPAL